MRNLILASLLLSVPLFAQTTFAPVGAKWTYLERFAFSSDSALFVIESVGDTVIQGHASRILEATGGVFCTAMYRYVRTSNDTVFFWEPVSGSFEILYITDAISGATWNTTVSSPSWELTEVRTATVTNTSMISIDGLPLQRLVVSYGSGSIFDVNPGPHITERLGSHYGLFPWRLGFCDGDYLVALRCYEDDEISWMNPQFTQCALSVGIAERSPNPFFTVRPTLSASYGPIEIKANAGTMELLDHLGRCVMKRTIAGQVIIHVKDPGSYVVRFTSNDDAVSHTRILVL